MGGNPVNNKVKTVMFRGITSTMFMNDGRKKEEIRKAVTEELRSLGIKYRHKKPRHNVQEQKKSNKVFGVSLSLLPMQTVVLESGQQLVIPKLVHELCSYILNKIETEGLFRKEGSKARQNEIKLSLNAGCHLGDEHHVIDVASLLKTFFRELPEPLFPQIYHDLFLRCTLLRDNIVRASLLGCLLLPIEHLNTLAYFMQSDDVIGFNSSNFELSWSIRYQELCTTVILAYCAAFSENQMESFLLYSAFSRFQENDMSESCVDVLKYNILLTRGVSDLVIMDFPDRYICCRFLQYVTEFSTLNKMDAKNLAIVFGPTLMPLDEKSSSLTTQHQLSKICLLFKLLIENAVHIGVLPESIVDRIASLSISSNSLTEDENLNIKKKQRRRSGSLTRMFNGLMKIVGGNGKSGDTSGEKNDQSPDVLQTPKLTKSAKKRKMEAAGFSQKKRKEVINTLPQNAILSVPYTPSRTPISVHPNPRKSSPTKSPQKGGTSAAQSVLSKSKKSQWNLGYKRKYKKEIATPSVEVAGVSSTKSLLELRLSSVRQAASFKRSRKRNSCSSSAKDKISLKTDTGEFSTELSEIEANSDVKLENNNLENVEPDYVKVPRTEYEEIKNRISSIEKRLSLELENFQPEEKDVINSHDSLDGITKVQTAYEKTLTSSGNLSPTTDQLAKRLSKELKIRRTAEHKVVRSPSARKIGSLRRRSRELDKNKAKLTRTRTWHDEKVQVVRKVNLKRGKPNTVFSGLPTVLQYDHLPDVVNIPPSSVEEVPSDAMTGQKPNERISFLCDHSPSLVQQQKHQRRSLNYQSTENCVPKDKTRRSLDSHNLHNISSSPMLENWINAEGFFRLKTTDSNNTDSCRASIARLRSQNAGMVLAKAKLFDHLSESDDSQKVQKTVIRQTTKMNVGKKIGSVRIVDKARSLKYEDKSDLKKNNSPRKRTCRVAHPNIKISGSENFNDKENFFVTNTAVISEKEQIILQDTPPTAVPHIKKSLKKSPKRLVHIPISYDTRKTPLKAILPSDLNY